ncbi:MAG: hypothetical protein DSY55_06485 [Clostridia bacterium]|nr:MAG: hypothetical protein DSY55_06485 [Clostridia bacterium]
MKPLQWLALLVLAIGLIWAVMTAAVWAQSSSSYHLGWHSMDSGGGKASATSFRLVGSVGQTDAGELFSTNFRLQGGFQQAFSQQTRLYLPSIVH